MIGKVIVAGVKGGWLHVVHIYPSEVAQNFWAAISAWTSCFVITIIIGLATKPRNQEELKGLVYSLTPRPAQEHLKWYQRPVLLAVCVLGGAAILNFIFW